MPLTARRSSRRAATQKGLSKVRRWSRGVQISPSSARIGEVVNFKVALKDTAKQVKFVKVLPFVITVNRREAAKKYWVLLVLKVGDIVNRDHRDVKHHNDSPRNPHFSSKS